MLELSKNAHSAFLQREGQEKIELLKIVGQNFWFDGENVIIEPFPPFDLIYKRNTSHKLEMAGVEPASIVDKNEHLRV